MKSSHVYLFSEYERKNCNVTLKLLRLSDAGWLHDNVKRHVFVVVVLLLFVCCWLLLLYVCACVGGVRERACARACVCVCVSVCVRACVSACVRVFTQIKIQQQQAYMRLLCFTYLI